MIPTMMATMMQTRYSAWMVIDYCSYLVTMTAMTMH
jgi:hypothetical protein